MAKTQGGTPQCSRGHAGWRCFRDVEEKMQTGVADVRSESSRDLGCNHTLGILFEDGVSSPRKGLAKRRRARTERWGPRTSVRERRKSQQRRPREKPVMWEGRHESEAPGKPGKGRNVEEDGAGNVPHLVQRDEGGEGANTLSNWEVTGDPEEQSKEAKSPL